MKVLIVEGEVKTGGFLRKRFSENDSVVDPATSGEDGLHLALTGAYNFIVVDVMMPGRDSWSVLQK